MYKRQPLPGQEAALLVQSNISETQEWTPEILIQTVREQAALTLRGALQAGVRVPSIIVWPEVPAPYYYEQDAGFREYVNNLARMTQAHILLGLSLIHIFRARRAASLLPASRPGSHALPNTSRPGRRSVPAWARPALVELLKARRPLVGLPASHAWS